MRRVALTAILGMITMLVACGSEGPTKSAGKRDGKIYVLNDSDLVLEVTVKYGDNIVKTTKVHGRSTKTEVSDVIEGGTEVTVILDVLSQESGPNVGFVQGDPTTQKITINGSVTIKMTAVNFSGDQWRADFEIIG